MLRQFVDDIRVTFAHKTLRTVALTTRRNIATLAQGLVALGCKISTKTTLLASRKCLRKDVVRALRQQGIPIQSATWAKDLGVATTAGAHRTSYFIRSRINGTRSRVKRIRVLARTV